mmetsp:Transcript_25502/g.54394  ORF Transcript_25502/g.54394 Transcript_25502/m.54394 type:complete len:414 (+) Transcript_25502:1750-2991(+)
MGILSAEDGLVAVFFLCSGSEVLEFLQSLVESAGEGFLFVSNDRNNVILLFDDFGEGLSHDFDKLWYELAEKSEIGSEVLSSISHRAPQYSPENVTTSVVRWNGSIGDGKTQGSDVIGDDSIGHIHESIVLLRTDLASVWSGSSRQHPNFFEKRLKDIRVVVGIDTLQDRGQSLESHTRIDVLRWQRAQASVGFAIELNKDVVPDLDNVGQVGIDQLGRIASTDSIVVNFRTWPARSSSSHFPEVIGGIERQHTFGGQILQPDVACFQIGWGHLVSTEISCVQTRRVEFEFVYQTRPSHGDGFFFEVIPEGPVSKHFEKGVVVNIFSDVVQIIVFSSGTDAFLGVDGTLELCHGQGRVAGSQKQRLVLVHAGIGEQQGRIVDGNARTRLPKLVFVLFTEKIDEGRSDLVHRPF